MLRPVLLALVAFGHVTLACAENEAKLNDDPQTFRLRYKFKRGQFLHYETDSSSTMRLVANQFTQIVKESRQTQKHLRVVAVDADGSALLEPVLDRVIMSAQADNGRPVVFDSESKSRPPKDFGEIAELVGKAVVRIRYHNTGAVDEVLPIAGLEDRLPKDDTVHSFLVVLPENEVAVGAKWNDDFSVVLAVTRTLHKKVTIRRRYRLEKVVDGVAHISFNTYPLSIVDQPQLQAQLIQRSLSGAVRFDIEKGVIREWTSNGNGQVFDALGPASSMKASSKSIERFVARPRSKEAFRKSVIKDSPVRSRPEVKGPIGPQLPGAAGS